MFSYVWWLLPLRTAPASGTCWCWFKVGAPMTVDLAFFPDNDGGMHHIWIQVGAGNILGRHATSPGACSTGLVFGSQRFQGYGGSGRRQFQIWLFAGTPRDLFIIPFYLGFFLKKFLETCHFPVFLVASACMYSCTRLLISIMCAVKKPCGGPVFNPPHTLTFCDFSRFGQEMGRPNGIAFVHRVAT